MSDFKTFRSALDVEIKTLNDVVADIAKDGIEVDGANVTIDEKRYKVVEDTKKRITELKNLLGTEGELKDLKAWLEEGTDTPAVFNASHEYKSVADHLLDSTEFKDMIDNGRASMRSDVRLEIADLTGQGSYGVKDVYTNLGSANGLGKPIGRVTQELPPLGPVRDPRPFRVRDLFPVARTNANLIEYFKTLGLKARTVNVQTGVPVGNADVVAERTGDNTEYALKPKSAIDFTSASDPIRTIAHWIPAHRNTLADKPALRSIINGELLYGLALEEDYQLLRGSGTGENILGLLNRPGIQTYTAPGGELKSDSLRRAQTLCELAFFPATGYILHPNDWEDIEIQKGSTNDHYMLVSNVAVGAQSRVWRLPVASTPGITEGTFLAGAWGQAAQVWDREQANLRVAEQHADFFIRNAIVILAEERIGLTVQRPEGIVRGTFAV